MISNLSTCAALSAKQARSWPGFVSTAQGPRVSRGLEQSPARLFPPAPASFRTRVLNAASDIRASGAFAGPHRKEWFMPANGRSGERQPDCSMFTFIPAETARRVRALAEPRQKDRVGLS